MSTFVTVGDGTLHNSLNSVEREEGGGGRAEVSSRGSYTPNRTISCVVIEISRMGMFPPTTPFDIFLDTGRHASNTQSEYYWFYRYWLECGFFSFFSHFFHRFGLTYEEGKVSC